MSGVVFLLLIWKKEQSPIVCMQSVRLANYTLIL